MNTNKKYIITIGLSKEDMSTQLNKNSVLQIVVGQLLHIGVEGFNLKEQVGFWKGEQENSLEVSFINTFDVEESYLIKSINELKEILEQASILLEVQDVRFDFI